MDARIYSEEMISRMKSMLRLKVGNITFPKFIFICGKEYNGETLKVSNRGVISDFIRSVMPEINIVYSEEVWNENFSKDIDLLTFEEFLAEVSDVILIFIESAGTICELGAFSNADKAFFKKLIIVNDQLHRESKSFITTGPIAKAERTGAKVIYADLGEHGLLSNDELRSSVQDFLSRMNTVSDDMNKRPLNTDGKKVLLGSFIIEILELLKILQPILHKDLIDIYKRVKGFSNFTFVRANGDNFSSEIKIKYIIELLKICNIIKEEKQGLLLTDKTKIKQFMFKYNLNSENGERSRLLCRRYRYEGKTDGTAK